MVKVVPGRSYGDPRQRCELEEAIEVFEPTATRKSRIESKKLWCKVHNPKRDGWRFVPLNSLRCVDGPPPTADDIFDAMPVGEPVSLHSLARRFYPTVGLASAKGGHHGIAFRMAAIKKYMVKLMAAGRVRKKVTDYRLGWELRWEHYIREGNR
jgi:hypothetical protein